MRRLGRYAIAWIVCAGLVIVAIQIWATLENAWQMEEAVGRILVQLEPLQDKQLGDEKARQEVLALRIENEMRGYFWNGLLIGVGPMVTVFVTLLGALLGLQNYLDARAKEHLERSEAREKERLDRAAADFKDSLERLKSQEPWERAAGIIGLQHLLTPDLPEYHLRAFSALATAARHEVDLEVLGNIRLAIEQAVRGLAPETLRRAAWFTWQPELKQRVMKLRGLNLAGDGPEQRRDLRYLDFRDAYLEDADLRYCDLSGSLFTNAQLMGAKLDASVLREADLAYADLAGASLVGADLRGAVLHHAKVLRMNLHKADLRGARFDPDQMPWEQIEHWRDASYDAGVLERLLGRYGPTPHGPRVLMLMWEIPPLVAGGTWTACYHLVRNLRRRGADVTVVVPWDEAAILPNPFGCEVRVIPLGIVPPRPAVSPYAPPWGVYGAPPWSSYAGLYPPYGAGPCGSAYSGYIAAGSTVLHLSAEFGRRLMRLAEQEPFELIHAHDWVTFDAAATVAHQAQKPWVAHFHSTETERRPAVADAVIERIEGQGAHAASHVVVPSRITAQRLQALYRVDPTRISVVPNSLSREEIPPAEMGSFENKRTIFLGRLSPQKGPDRFAQVAAKVCAHRHDATFWVFGTGESSPELFQPCICLRGGLDWGVRGTAFGGATALLLPSRAEPFGMVVLEAMQHRVPVLYPRDAGVAEVIQTGVTIDPEDIAATVERLLRLLEDWRHWEEVVQAQSREVGDYPERGYEQGIIELWGRLKAERATVP